MPTRPLDHPRKKPGIRFVSASAVAVSDPRYKNRGQAPTVLNAVLVDSRGRAWWWDGVTERGARMTLRPKGDGEAAATIRTRRAKTER